MGALILPAPGSVHTYAALKIPHALYAATALSQGCGLFITNDVGFRHIPGLPVAILDDAIARP